MSYGLVTYIAGQSNTIGSAFNPLTNSIKNNAIAKLIILLISHPQLLCTKFAINSGGESKIFTNISENCALTPVSYLDDRKPWSVPYYFIL
jgi:hypothetical protein